jgi:hypothetical protein
VTTGGGVSGGGAAVETRIGTVAGMAATAALAGDPAPRSPSRARSRACASGRTTGCNWRMARARPSRCKASLTATSHTLELIDLGSILETTGSSAVTVTIPDEASVPFEIGTLVNVTQVGAGIATVTAAAGRVAQWRDRRLGRARWPMVRRSARQARGGCLGHPGRAGGGRRMSLLMMRAAILAQGGDTGPPVDIGSAWELDVTRRPRATRSRMATRPRSTPRAAAITAAGCRPPRRSCPRTGGATGRCSAPRRCCQFDGYLGVVSDEQREEYDAGNNPITLGSIGYRGNGTLWSSNTGHRQSAPDRACPLWGGRCGDVRVRSRHRQPLGRAERYLARRSGERRADMDRRAQRRLLSPGPGARSGRWRHAALAALAVQLSGAARRAGAGL